MNRRDFVAAVTAAGTAAGAFAAAPALAGHTGYPVFAIVFDQRYEAARSYGKAAATRGNTVFGYHGDLTSVWREEIEPKWARRAGGLAGMTTSPALFCLEQLAAQHWLRVVSRFELPAGPGERLLSWIIAR